MEQTLIPSADLARDWLAPLGVLDRTPEELLKKWAEGSARTLTDYLKALQGHPGPPETPRNLLKLLLQRNRELSSRLKLSRVHEIFRSVLNLEASETRLVTAGEYLAESPDSAPSYYGDGLITKGGLVIVAGPKDAKKSHYLKELAVHLATGTPYHGLAVPAPVRVLVMDAESNHDAYRSRLRSLIEAPTPGESYADNLLFLERGQPLPQVGWQLENIIRKYQPGVIVLDTVNYFVSLTDENSASEWKSKYFRPLRAMLRPMAEQAPAIIGATHTVKGGTWGGLNSVRGSSAIVGDASTVVLMEPRGGKLRQSFWVKDGPPLAPRSLDYDATTGQLRLLGACADPVDKELVAVRRVLEAGGGWEAVVAELGCSRATAFRHLRDARAN